MKASDAAARGKSTIFPFNVFFFPLFSCQRVCGKLGRRETAQFGKKESGLSSHDRVVSFRGDPLPPLPLPPHSPRLHRHSHSPAPNYRN